MATAIAAPLMAEAYPPTSMRNSIPSCWPSVLTMVPMSREQNRPWAMAPRASIPYRLADISMFFRFRNSLIRNAPFPHKIKKLYRCQDTCTAHYSA